MKPIIPRTEMARVNPLTYMIGARTRPSPSFLLRRWMVSSPRGKSSIMTRKDPRMAGVCLTIPLDTLPLTEVMSRPEMPITRAQVALGTDRALTREADGTFSVERYASVREAVLDIGSRHPMTRETISDIAARMDGEAELVEMSFRGELVEVGFEGRRYLLPNHLVAERDRDQDMEVG